MNSSAVSSSICRVSGFEWPSLVHSTDSHFLNLFSCDECSTLASAACCMTFLQRQTDWDNRVTKNPAAPVNLIIKNIEMLVKCHISRCLSFRDNGLDECANNFEKLALWVPIERNPLQFYIDSLSVQNQNPRIFPLTGVSMSKVKEKSFTTIL